MNSYIPSGTTLFDVLSMIIPGGLIIGFIADILKLTPDMAGSESIFYILLFVSSYFVGLIWNVFMDKIFVKFRNNNRHIKSEYRRFRDFQKRANLTKKGGCRACFNLCRRNSSKSKALLYRYLRDYYASMDTPIFRVIVILETQVSFIKNILIIIVLYGFYLLFFVGKNKIIAGLFSCSCPIIIGLILIVISILLFKVMIYRQRKIYYLIFEGQHYKKKAAR